MVPVPEKADFQAGKEYGNNGQCNPTYFTVGALVNYLKRLRDVEGVPTNRILDDYVFVTAGACGPCRFGMYEAEFRLALRNSGFDGFRVLLFQQKGGMKQSGGEAGLDLNINFALAFLNGLFIGDEMNALANQVRPYEVVPGQTDAVFAKAMELLEARMRERDLAAEQPGLAARIGARSLATLANPGDVEKILTQLGSDYYVQVLRECREMIDREIEVDYTRPKPICKVTGEFWAQTTEGDGNFHIFAFLESQGAEVLTEPIITWVTYLISQERAKLADRTGLGLPENWLSKLKSGLGLRKGRLRLDIARWVVLREYDRIRQALGGITHAPACQLELQRLGHPYYNRKSGGGEGHLEVAKNIYYFNKSMAHMVLSLKPFGCMPSTQSDGAQAAVTSRYPEMIYLPIETSGEGDINAHSRAQMALGEAKAKCKLEFQAALTRTGYSLDAIRAYCAERPELRRPLQHIPHLEGVVGRAANFVQHVAAQMARENIRRTA
jgi:predicted nucleotide-binding protein (sugar kinase/HSP70/actin superfamily)